MKRLFHLLCGALLVCGAAGCSDSDDVQEPNLRDDATLIVGRWQTTFCADAFYENGKLVDTQNDPDDWFTFELFADGTFTWTEEGDRPDTGTYRYDTQDYSLNLHFENGLGGDFGLGYMPTVVTHLSAGTMVLTLEDTYTEEGIEFFMRRVLSFRRID